MQTRRQTLGGVRAPVNAGSNNNQSQRDDHYQPQLVSRRTSLGDYYNKRFAPAPPETTFPSQPGGNEEYNATASIPRQPQRKVNSVLRNNQRKFDENLTGDLGGGAIRSARKMRPTLGGGGGMYQDDVAPAMPMASSRPSMMMVQQDKRDFQTSEGKSAGIRRVIEFLSSRSYSRALSEAELASPTVTAFKQLLFSILSLLDLNTAQSLRVKAGEKTSGWENAVCLLFRQIKYPFTLSPKQINAVGSANAWPKFLAALVWLCDLVDVGEVEIESQLFHPERNALMNDLTNAYSNYMEGDDGALDHVMNKLAQSVELQIKDVNRRVGESKARIGELESNYTKLKEPPSAAEDDVSFGESLSSLSKQLEALANDRMQMEKNLPVWRTKCANASGALQQGTSKLQELQALKEATEEKRREEEKRMNSQVVKNADLSRLAAERANVERALSETEKEHAELSRQNWTLTEQNQVDQAEVDSKRQDLVSRLKALSAASSMIIANKLFDASERQVEFNTCELFLKEAHKRMMARVSKARNDSLDLKSQLDKNLEQTMQVESRVERLQAETRRWEEKQALVEREMALELESIQAEMEMEKELKAQFEQVSQCVAEENEVRRLRLELERKRQEWFAESSALEERIRGALIPVVGTKERLEGMIKPAVHCVQRCEEEIAAAAKQHLELLQ